MNYGSPHKWEETNDFFFFFNSIVEGAGVKLWMSLLETPKSLNQLSYKVLGDLNNLINYKVVQHKDFIGFEQFDLIINSQIVAITN